MPRRAATAVAALLAIALFASCGAGGEGGSGSTGASVATEAIPMATHPAATPLTRERLRDLIVRGVGEDFRAGTGVGPRGYGLCVRLGMRRALDGPELRRLLAASRRHGTPAAAQALNGLAVPIGDACGGRQYVPELTGAATAFEHVRLVETAGERAGVAYGPFIGISCRTPNRRACDRVGIDLVLRRPARSVIATVAGRSLRLVTPGPVPHDAEAAGRDWGGFLERVALWRQGSSFHLPVGPSRHWAGSPAVRLPVWLSVAYPGGRHRTLKLPPATLSPGFG